MARYTGTVPTTWSPGELFAYMADVHNFAEWDPGTRRVTQVVGDGPGADAEYRVEVDAGGRTIELPYTVQVYDAPRRIVLEGSTRVFELHDEITVSAVRAGAAVTYDARVELRGVLRVLDPLLARSFRKNGDRAARGLRSVLAQRAPGAV